MCDLIWDDRGVCMYERTVAGTNPCADYCVRFYDAIVKGMRFAPSICDQIANSREFSICLCHNRHTLRALIIRRRIR